MSEKRMTASERESLLRLGVIASIIDRDTKALESRNKIVKNSKRDLAMLRTVTINLFKRYIDTIPIEQHKNMERSLKSTHYHIGVSTSQGNREKLDKDYGLIVSYADMNVIRDGLKDHCLMCGCSPEEQTQCKLRKALDMTYNDVEERTDGRCPYREAL